MVGALTFGKLADDHGSRPVVLIGITLMAARFAGMGLSGSLWQISLTYGVMVGMAMGACSLVICRYSCRNILRRIAGWLSR